jgi:hypothetical protein
MWVGLATLNLKLVNPRARRSGQTTLGAPFGGEATDINSGALLATITLTY